MAPLKTTPKQTHSDKKAPDILDLAREVVALLRDRSAFPATLEADLRTGIKGASVLLPTPASTSKASEFDARGTDLWNATTNLLRESEDQQQEPRLRRDAPTRTTVLLRVFAFRLLDIAYSISPKRTKDFEQRTRNLKLALKTCRTCLENDELDLCQKVLERCSDHVSLVEEESPLVRLTENSRNGDCMAKVRSLAAEFYLLRIMHAWKSGRLDVARHFVNKLEQHAQGLREEAADLFYEIGKSLATESDTTGAVEWLERGLSTLDACETEQLSDGAADLRLSIGSKLVRCLSADPDPNGHDRAHQIVQQLAEDPVVGNRLAVQVMQLDVLLVEVPTRPERMHTVLSRILRSTVLTDVTFKIIMQAIHRTKKSSFSVAQDTLRALICDRLIPIITLGEEADLARLEQSCVTFILLAVNAPGNALSSAPQSVCNMLDVIAQNAGSSLSPKAIHAMQTLIWKASRSSDALTTAVWLQLLRHSAFDGAGSANKARIGRKTIDLALQREDFDAAREAYYKMPPGAQSENLTQYLIFKLALRCNDFELARESLESIVKRTRDDAKYLYACVLEAQQSNMRQIAVAALIALLDKQPPGVHLPTLLRCTVRLLAEELDSSNSEQPDGAVEEIVKIFERATTNIKTLREAVGEQWRAEMQWWSKNAYNLSLRLCVAVHPELLCRLLGTSIAFLDNLIKHGGVMREDDVKGRKMLCHFLCASALIVLARSDLEGEEYSLQCYVNCRQHALAFKTLVDGSSPTEDMSRRMFELLKYEVESILRLQKWDQLYGVLQACLDCKNVDRWDTLADLVFIIHGQSGSMGLEENENSQMIALIQRIINETWKKEKDLVKVSRWLRLSFSIDLSDGEGAFALKLLQQAADMARKGWESGSSEQTYPEVELQWLATVSFNKGIDFLTAKEYAVTKTWMEGALEMARYASDSGLLHGHLSYKRDLAMKRMEEAERTV